MRINPTIGPSRGPNSDDRNGSQEYRVHRQEPETMGVGAGAGRCRCGRALLTAAFSQGMMHAALSLTFALLQMSSTVLHQSVSASPINTGIYENRCSCDHCLRKSLVSKELRKRAEDKLRVCSRSHLSPRMGASARSQGRQPWTGPGHQTHRGARPKSGRSPGLGSGRRGEKGGGCFGDSHPRG